MNKNIDVTKYIGAPFKLGGSCLERGIDCFWVLVKMYQDFGLDLDLPEDDLRAGYRDRAEARLAKSVWKKFVQIDKPTQIADLLVFENTDGKAQHLGIMISRSQFIHASPAGVSICTVDSQRGNISDCYRHREAMC